MIHLGGPVARLRGRGLAARHRVAAELWQRCAVRLGMRGRFGGLWKKEWAAPCIPAISNEFAPKFDGDRGDEEH